MAKVSLSSEQLFKLRSTLQSATIEALMASRKWQPGEIAFQGGTCLSLVHGSERFSEDLDFMIRGGLTLAGLSNAIEKRLDLPHDVPSGLRPSVSVAKDDRNPHAFYVTLSGDGYLGSAKVKVELWQTSPRAMDNIDIVVRPITTALGRQVFVPAEPLEEILADKVYALGARDRVKPRDIFDLWWIQKKQPGITLQSEKLLLRLDIYPKVDRETTAQAWIAAAQERIITLNDASNSVMSGLVEADLKKWLPPYWPMSQEMARQMIDCSAQWLERGLSIMRQGHDQGHDHKESLDADSEGESPGRPRRG